MLQATLPRQFITNTQDQAIAVILPMKEYEQIKDILDEKAQEEERMLKEMETAVNDPLFMADLVETMESFEAIDSEWWEINIFSKN